MKTEARLLQLLNAHAFVAGQQVVLTHEGVVIATISPREEPMKFIRDIELALTEHLVGNVTVRKVKEAPQSNVEVVIHFNVNDDGFKYSSTSRLKRVTHYS